MRTILAFGVGAVAGILAMYRASRLEVSMAQMNGYMQGGIRAAQIIDDVYRDELAKKNRRGRR